MFRTITSCFRLSDSSDEEPETWDEDSTLYRAPRAGPLRLVLLSIWALTAFGGCYFARDIDALAGGRPLAYWFAAQGVLIIFIALVVIYATVLNRMEARETRNRIDTDKGHDGCSGRVLSTPDASSSRQIT
jgi:putative solute:sodium symporter small subunit